MAERTSVRACETAFVTRRVVMPNMLNGNGIVFGGALLSIYDECAGISALALTHGKVATVSIEKVSFKRPIFNGETIVVKSRVIYTGRTSLVVKLDADVEILGEPVGHAGDAIFNFVGIDDEGHPKAVPQLIPETEEEKQLWAQVEASRKR